MRRNDLPWLLTGLLFTLCGGLVARPAAAQDFTIEMDENQFSHMVFNNGDGARNMVWLGQLLHLQLQSLAAIGTLTDQQRDKLELAGHGDIHRFLVRYETLDRERPTGKISQDDYSKLWQKVQPLQLRFQEGLFGPGSLYRKTIRSVLDADQLARYETMQHDRDLRHYRATIKGVVALLEQKVPFTIEQRNKLIELTLEKTEPPLNYGQSYNRLYVVLAQMAEIPEEDLKPLFLDNEWAVLQALFRQARASAQAQRRALDQAALEE